MNQNEALQALLANKDPEVRRLAGIVDEAVKRRRRILDLVQEALSQLRLDMKYIMFDLECTRRERDEARGKA